MRVVRVMLGVVLACLLAVPPVGALRPSPAAAAAGEPVLHTLTPAPGSVVASGDVAIRVHVRGDEPLDSVRLLVDDEPVTAVTIERVDPRWGTAVSTVVTLEPGEHRAQLEVTDGAGARASRTWSFTVTDRTIRRHSGPTRFETAVAISRAGHPDPGSAPSAVLARADDFADALAGAPLARFLDGPLLLAATDGLPAQTAEELRRVLPPGATVHLLGGPAALGPEVEAAVAELGFAVVRHAGPDRFATAAVIAEALPPADAAIVVSGGAFPDALAASAPAARDGLPILLTAADRLPAATADALATRGVSSATVVGGRAVVSPEVEEEVRALTGRVARVSGPDRYATAAAVLDAFFDEVEGAVLASGAAFPDALAGGPLAAASAQPLLLTDPAILPAATDEALRRHQPTGLTVLGGPGALGRPVEGAALRAAVDGTRTPRLAASAPAGGAIVADVEAITVELDRDVDAAATSLYVELDGLEILGRLEIADDGRRMTLHAPGLPLPFDARLEGRIVVAGAGTGGLGHHEVAFTYLRPDPVFATVGPLALHLPSRTVELVGFHQSGHDGARDLAPRDTATPKLTMASRGRGTGLLTAADVVADPDVPVVAPITGRVIRGGSYVLYCRYTDEYAVIEPDDRPGWEVKVLHVRGLAVQVGDRVEADRTIIAAAPRILPFASQVDDHSQPRNWPHVHVEVVDPSIPTRPGGGC